MKIVYVNDAIAIWGGLERILVDKVNELTERYGYDMYLLTTDQGCHPIPYSLNSKVVHNDLGINFNTQYRFHGIRRLVERMKLKKLLIKRLEDIVNQIQPDIIVCARPELARVVVKVKGNIPFVFESHTSRYSQRFINADLLTKIKAEFYNRNVRFADLVVALTEGDANDWYEINRSVCVIPNIVHLNCSNRFCDYSSKNIIFVGRFSAQKDITSLLHIWQIVYSYHPDWTLHIYGGYGEEQSSLLPLIMQLDTNVVVHEPTESIFDCYMESSILLLTSRFEPFGLVIPEAMSCGLPVVSFDCPYGPADIITDGIDGFLIKNRDMNEFVKKVCLLIDNPELRKTMGNAGIESSKRYATSVIMPKWKDIFEKLSRK